MSDLPTPQTRRQKTELYIALAKEYVTGENSMCGLCTPFMRRTGFVPDRRAIWKYVHKIKNREIS
jgi:hypothetical protein